MHMPSKHPFSDVMKIAIQLGRYVLSSFTATVVDYCTFMIIYGMSRNVLLSAYTARFFGASVSYNFNKHLVFQCQSKDTLPKYIVLVTISGLVSTLLIYAITPLVLGYVLIAKLAADGVLYLCNFAIQKQMIFKD